MMRPGKVFIDANVLNYAAVYHSNVWIIQGFVRLSIKKKQEGREVKYTSNIGEIDSLAAAMFLSVNFICSNDYEIRELIQNENLCVSPGVKAEADYYS